MSVKPLHPTPEVTVKQARNTFKLYGRHALAFLVWWRSSPSDKPKVEFYPAVAQRGYTFEALHKGALGALTRSQLVVSTNVPE